MHECPVTPAYVLQVCVGVAASTVTDRQVGMSLVGLLVGAAAVAATALYQVLPPYPPPEASPPSCCSPEALHVADLSSSSWL